MFTLLFARVFLIIGGMLIVTASTARINKAFETVLEMWTTIILTFIFLFSVIFFADSYPINLIMVTIFSALIGWEIGPTIEHYSKSFKFGKFKKENGIVLKKGQKITVEQEKDFEKYLTSHPNQTEWNTVISQALFATALAVIITASIVFLVQFDFSILEGFLFISLLILIIGGVLNIFFFKSKLFSLVRAYIGILVFTGYLLYDFNQLEKFAEDKTWGTAINIAVNIYLDIINLFLDFLEIMSDN